MTWGRLQGLERGGPPRPRRNPSGGRRVAPEREFGCGYRSELSNRDTAGVGSGIRGQTLPLRKSIEAAQTGSKEKVTTYRFLFPSLPVLKHLLSPQGKPARKFDEPSRARRVRVG